MSAYAEPHDINTSLMEPLRPHVIVLFGATGDLAKRKLLPGLYHRDRDRQLPPECRIIGVARRDLGRQGYVAQIEENLRTLDTDRLAAVNLRVFGTDPDVPAQLEDRDLFERQLAAMIKARDEGLIDAGLKLRTMRLPDRFQDQDSPNKQYDEAGLNAPHIVDTVLKALRRNSVGIEVNEGARA